MNERVYGKIVLCSGKLLFILMILNRVIKIYFSVIYLKI